MDFLCSFTGCSFWWMRSMFTGPMGMISPSRVIFSRPLLYRYLLPATGLGVVMPCLCCITIGCGVISHTQNSVKVTLVVPFRIIILRRIPEGKSNF